MVLLFIFACVNPSGTHSDRDASDGPSALPPDATPETVDEAPGAGFPFDRDEVFEVAIDLPQSSIDGLCRTCEHVPGTIRFAGLEQEVGVRYKGASTFDTLEGKPSFKLDFGAFTPGARFLGLERLTLNGMRFDPTKLREAAAYQFFEMLGVPAPRHGFAHLTINGDDYGLYGLVETLDEHFLARAFPDDRDGNLYDTTFVSSDLTTAALGTFVLEEGDPATATTDLASLVTALDTGNILDVIQTRFEPESTLTFLAMDLAGPNYDGYTRNINNFLLYHAMPSDRWSFVPWGQDRALYGGGPVYAQMKGRIALACVADAACQAELSRHVFEVLDVWEQQDLLGWTEETASRIAAACEADPRREDECELQEMLEHLAVRPDEVRSFMP